jgi:transcriptional regulator of arginine metabolism
MDYSENIIVIKTVSGMAMAVGAAIDNLRIEGIMGCIAGDDTLFLAIKKKEQAAGIMNRIAAVRDVKS